MNTKYSWIHPLLEVKIENRYGKGNKGIFSSKRIRKGSILAVFGGEIVDTLNDSISDDSDYYLQISSRFLIGIKKVSETDFFNHSCSPNSGIKGQIFLVAMRDIKPKEEVTFDYAMILQKMRGVETYKFKCNCGHKDCRKMITENDWKKPHLQKQYRGFFNTFLQERIDNLTT